MFYAAADTNGDNVFDVTVEFNTDGGLTDTYHVDTDYDGWLETVAIDYHHDGTMDEIYQDTNFDTVLDTVIL